MGVKLKFLVTMVIEATGVCIEDIKNKDTWNMSIDYCCGDEDEAWIESLEVKEIIVGERW